MVARCLVVRTGSFLNMVDNSSLIGLLPLYVMGRAWSNGNATALTGLRAAEISGRCTLGFGFHLGNKAWFEYFCPKLGYFEQTCTNNASIATSIAKQTPGPLLAAVWHAKLCSSGNVRRRTAADKRSFLSSTVLV